MRMYDVITKKKHGEELSKEEIEFVVEGFTKEEIPDYQMSALLMAICLKGMTDEETVNLTMAMAHSGDMLDLSPIEGIKVDKHSTGGVGDKTSLSVGPIVACFGIPVAKMSGRGLGHTGGTIDKLESIPGFRTDISNEAFFDTVNRCKLAIIGQTANLAPADKKIYALRDVTATVDNLSLIASSIMSKKLAAGADAIVLDVKTGSGAFMKKTEDSIALAEMMVRIGNMAGRKTYAVITDMNQPLGELVGNNLEVREAAETLMGKGPEDFVADVTILGKFMLLAAGKANNLIEAETMVKEMISSGKALDKFAEFVRAQGGDDTYIYHPEHFEKAKITVPVLARESGYVSAINTEEVGISCLILGRGRATKADIIDPTVGIRVLKKIGDSVTKDEPIAYLYANSNEKAEQASVRLANAYSYSDSFVEKPKTLYGYVDENGYHEF